MTDLKKVCAQKLEVLVPNITPKDREIARDTIPISKPTLDKYLRGEIIKLDTATKLIMFFSQRIKERMELLQGAD